MYLKELGVRSGMDLSGSGYEPAVASCEHGNKLSDSINGKNFMTS
jgi:hypothetical protein